MHVFDAIYVINLPARADRRFEMQAQLQRIGLSLDSEKVILFEAVRPTELGGFPTIGAKGCFMSHLSVLENALRKGFKTVLILEDDCNFTKDFLDRIALLDTNPWCDNWHIMYGGTLTQRINNKNSTDFRLLPADQALMGSHCIGLRDSVLPDIVRYFKAIISRPAGHPSGGPMHVDGAYSWFRKDNPNLLTILAEPGIAYQRSSATDIHEQGLADKYHVFAPFVKWMRKIKNFYKNSSL